MIAERFAGLTAVQKVVLEPVWSIATQDLLQDNSYCRARCFRYPCRPRSPAGLEHGRAMSLVDMGERTILNKSEANNPRPRENAAFCVVLV